MEGSESVDLSAYALFTLLPWSTPRWGILELLVVLLPMAKDFCRLFFWRGKQDAFKSRSVREYIHPDSIAKGEKLHFRIHCTQYFSYFSTLPTLFVLSLDFQAYTLPSCTQLLCAHMHLPGFHLLPTVHLSLLPGSPALTFTDVCGGV